MATEPSDYEGLECPWCSYELTGLHKPVCPECGGRFDPVRLREIAREVDLPIHAFGHAGDGNLHVNVMVDRKDLGEMERARRAVSRLFATALSMDGTLSGEHGIGITKADHLALELGEAAVRVTAGVKRAFDPEGFLNPDKILTSRPNPWWRDLPPEDAPVWRARPDGRADEESGPC